jgi:methane/ammonia monooxygenase subunit B
MKRQFLKWMAAVTFGISALALYTPPASAHGERNQEPFLRMRTLHWYDVKWSTEKMKVNDELVITGMVRIFEDWPSVVPSPGGEARAFLSTAGPGSVMVKKESYINGQPMNQSTHLEKGRDYNFKLVMQARMPGRYHIHPTILVEGGGPLAGPGSWVDISGSVADFVLSVKTMKGATIPNLETWGVGGAIGWHALWAIVAVIWLLWWVRRPYLIPRYLALVRGREDLLITPTDTRFTAAMVAGTLILIFAGYNWAEAQYPQTIPLQAGESKVDPLPADAQKIKVKLNRATYDVPGRSLKMTITVSNDGLQPLELGEFTSANLRFINPHSSAARAGVAQDYPADLVLTNLKVGDHASIGPGETRTLSVDAADVAWELERLTGLLNDPDNRFGGLLFFYGADGVRHIANVYGPIVPVFK